MSTNCKAAIILVMLAVAIVGLSSAPAFAQYRSPNLAPSVGFGSRPVVTNPVASSPVGPVVRSETMDPPEYRAAWVYGFGGEYKNPAATSTVVNTLADNNFNVVIPEIRKNGDAYYNSAYEPWATDVQGGYDPLADMITKAHARGMEVYGWIVTYRIWGKGKTAPPTHIWTKHPDWALIDNIGRNYVGGYHNLDPGIPGVEDYIVNLMKDTIVKYPDLDGYNFDYIRYDSVNVGYNPISKARFFAEHGYNPPTSTSDANWPAWSAWKRQQVTDLVKRCYLEAIYLNPKIKMSVDTLGWMGGDPNTDFTGVRCYRDVCQDHKKWMEDGIVDLNVLMNYKRDWTGMLADSGYYYNGYPFGNQQADHRIWSDYLKNIQASTGRHTIDGVGGYMNIMKGVLDQWAYSRANGVGLGMYRYGATVGAESSAAPGLPIMSGNAVVYSNTKGYEWLEPAFYNAMKPAMFQNPAPIPDMPWKTAPTKGYLFGQVTDSMKPNHPVYQDWVYKATVTLVGPSSDPHTQTTVTDGTGSYGFLNLEPGDYTVTVSMPSFSTIEDYPASVTAGLATKADFSLAPYLTSGDYKSLREANNPTLVPDGTIIGVLGKVLTTQLGALSDSVYVEEADRSTGLQVKFGVPTTGIVEGDRIGLIGRITTVGGERVLTQASVQAKSAGDALTPLASNVRDLSRAPASTALLVKAGGKVTDVGIGWFNISDGSGIVKVKCPGLLVPARNSYAQVVGINSVDAAGRSIRVRRQSDIAAIVKSAVAAPTSMIGSGMNLFSMPYVPTDQSPSSALTGLSISGSLFRWDNATQAFIPYDMLTPSVFGNICPNDGFAYLSTTTGTLTFEGIPLPAADTRVSCPKAGWSLISAPFSTPVLWSSIMVTDGIQTLGFEDAVAAGWIGRIAFTWDSVAKDFGYLGTGARGSRFDDSLRPWKAYWISTYQDNLAVIIPAPATTQ